MNTSTQTIDAFATERLHRAIDARAYAELGAICELAGSHTRAFDFAKAINVSNSYWRALGITKAFGDASGDILRSAAKYLNFPVLTVYMLADVLDAEDCFSPENLQAELEAGFAAMRSDPQFGPYSPDVQGESQLGLRTKISMVLMFEKISGQEFLSKTTVPAVA